MIEALEARVNDDEALVRRGRFLTTTFLLEVGQTAWLITIFEGRIVSVTPGPFVMPSSSFALRAPEEEWQKFWSEPAAARLQRPDGADQAARPEGRRRSADLHGQSALLQGSAGETARRRERRHERDTSSRSSAATCISSCSGGTHRIYVEEAGAGHAAAVPAHRRLRRTAVPRADERCARHGEPPRHRLRHALARQVVAAGRLAQRGIPADLGAIHRA